MASITVREARKIDPYEKSRLEARRFWTLLGLGLVAVTSLVTSYALDRDQAPNTGSPSTEEYAPFTHENPATATATEHDKAIAGGRLSIGFNQNAAQNAAERGDVARCEFYNQQAQKAAATIDSTLKDIVNCTGITP